MAPTAGRTAALLRAPTPEPTVPPDTTTPPPAAPQRQWAIVELFGHQRIAGAISQESFGGDTFTRIDVPQVSWPEEVFIDGRREVQTRTIPAHTKLLGAKAIYGIDIVDEPTALTAAHAIRRAPLHLYTLKEALAGLTQRERQLLLDGSSMA